MDDFTSTIDWIALAVNVGFSARALALYLAVSVRWLQIQSRKSMRMTPEQWLREVRLWLALQRLADDQRPKGIALALGYKDLSHFNHQFKQFFGCAPSQISLLRRSCRLSTRRIPQGAMTRARIEKEPSRAQEELAILAAVAWAQAPGLQPPYRSIRSETIRVRSQTMPKLTTDRRQKNSAKQSDSVRTSVQHLSARQQQVVELASNGLTNKEIADRLFISRHTVDTDWRHIFARLGVHSRTATIGAIVGTRKNT